VERAGDVTLQSRYLTYLTVIHRLSGSVEETRSAALRSLSAATAAGMVDYTGAARANLAWGAWRQGAAEARGEALGALELWQQLSITYPFQWMALLPLLAMEVEDDLESAEGRARALLEPKQQRLPEEITVALERGAEAFACGDAALSRAHLRSAVEAARRLKYL
jgi:hypothetical protein